MDSINKNQPEHNKSNLSGSKAIEKLKELVEKAETCFFSTFDLNSHANPTRPMSVLKVTDEGQLLFLSATDSHKNKELQADPMVQLYFQGSKHSDFLNLTGRASISKDKQIIEELWNPILKTWFTEGKDDARISVLTVDPQDGYYWDNKHGNAIAGIKIMIGAAIGKTLDDSIEGRLKP
ncbi:MAG: pyridoxamine 5'-phosphate oxidase family protein [Bacteroidota bacterium]